MSVFLFYHFWTRKAGPKKLRWLFFLVVLLVVVISSLRVQKSLRFS